MSSKAKSPKEEAPLSPTKGKKSTKKKDPKSPAKVKSVTKAAETPVKTSSKKKAAETPQTKPKEKKSGPYEARWKKAMCVARCPYLSRRRRRGATPSPRRRHAHTTQEHLPEVPARVRTRRHRFIWSIDGRHDAHDD